MIGRVLKYLKHRPILRRWIIIGLAISCLMGVTMIASALFMVQKLYLKEQKFQERVVEENMAIVDNACEEVVMGAQTFITNNQVKVASKKGDATVEDRMRLSEISTLMEEYMAVHSSFDKMYLIFPQANYGVLTETEYIHKEDTMRMLSGIDLEEDFNQKLFTEKLYSTFKIVGNTYDPQLYYSMATQFSAPIDEQDTVLLIKINKTGLRNWLDNNYTFFLVADDGEYIQFGDEEFSDDFISQCLSSEEKATVGHKTIYPHAVGSYGLKLVAVLDSGTVLSAVKPFILGVIVYGVVLMFIVAGISTYLLRRQYKPIESIISFLENNEVMSADELSEKNDEFKQIEEGIGRSLKMLQKSSDEFFEFVNDNATRLIRLLNYGTDILEKDNCDSYRYLVVSYDIDNPTGEPMDQKDREMVWFIIHNVSEELLGKENLLISGGLAHWFYNIVQLTGENDISLTELTQKLNTVCSFIREKFNIALVANISDIHHGKAGIPAANRESMLVREYRIYVGELPYVAFYKELSLDDDAKATLTSWDQMEQIQNMYRMHRGVEAQNMLDNMVSAAAMSSKEEVELDNSSQENFGKSALLAEKARDYVNESYADKNMNVNSIAAELNVNNSYLSRTFKQVFGVGMLEYINKVRLENAEKLMEKGLTVKDAADQVGFTTPRPLIRCFREKYGTTPGDYYRGR